jgi:Tfp pilus assembly protein FimT
LRFEVGMKTFLNRARSERGLTLLDTMVTVTIIGIVTTMATFQIGNTRRALQGDGAMRVLMTQLNTAREMAITQRRNMQVQFLGTNQVQIVRREVPNGTTNLTNVFFEGGVRYQLVSGIADTPDGFGNGSAVNFGAATAVMFSPDGTLVDQSGNPLNGTIFTSIPNVPQSYRAVTVLGSTGRVRGYRWNGHGWVRV